MRLPLRQSAIDVLPGTVGPVRTDRRLHVLLRKLRPGDIAVLDHDDLDRVGAQALLDRGAVGVVNAAPFISGRYPNLGPELLARSGVALLDGVGAEAFAALDDGEPGRLHDGALYVGEEVRLAGRALDLDGVLDLMDAAREGMAAQLQTVTHNAAELLRREPGLLLHGEGVPRLTTRMAGRPVVVVVRDHEHEADLRSIRRFIREQHPVLVGVDGGADALLDAGLRPDLVVVGEAGLAGAADGGAETVSDRALTRAGEVLVHVAGTSRFGVDRLERLGVPAERIVAGGTTEDAALLVADAEQASVLVSVGGHATLDDLLDRQRSGPASTLLTRLRVGPRLVDARSVPTLYAGGVRLWQLLAVLVVGLLALAVAVRLTPRGEGWYENLEAVVGAAAAHVEEAHP